MLTNCIGAKVAYKVEGNQDTWFAGYIKKVSKPDLTVKIRTKSDKTTPDKSLENVCLCSSMTVTPSRVFLLMGCMLTRQMVVLLGDAEGQAWFDLVWDKEQAVSNAIDCQSS